MLHDLSSFTCSSHPSPSRIDGKLCATDGDCVIAVPSSDLSHPVADPSLLSVFPSSRPQVFVPFPAASLAKVASYAASHCNQDEPLWLAFTPQGTSSFVQPASNVLFFCVAGNNGSRQLVSGVISTPTVDKESQQSVIRQAEAAINFSIPIPQQSDSDDLLVQRCIRVLRQRGYSVAEAVGEALTASIVVKRPTKRPRLTNLLRAIAAKDVKLVSQLIIDDVDLTERDKDGNHCLIHAALFGTPDIIRQIAAAAPSLLDAPDANGVWTAIMHAQDAGKIENAVVLRAAGAEFSSEHKEAMKR